MPAPNNLNPDIVDEMAKNHEPDHSPTRNSNNIIDVLSQVEKLLHFLSETTYLSANIYHPLNTTEQYQGNAGLNVGNIYKGLKSLNATLFTLIRIQNEEYGQGNNDTERVYDQDTAKHSSAIYKFELVINLFAIPILAFIGCILSTVGICYLLNGSRRTKIQNMLLSTLFSFDGLILFFMFLRGIGYSLRSILSTYSVSYHIVVSFAIRCFEISSIFTLVSLSHARLSAIRKPFQYSNNLLTWQERKKIWRNYLIPIIISSLILAAPLLLEFEFQDQDRSTIKPSFVRLHWVYSLLYVGLLNVGIIGILPMACLLYLSYHIKRELAKVNEIQDGLTIRRKERRTSSHPDVKTPEIQKHGIKMSKSLTNGIVVFVILHTFRIVTTFGEFCILFQPNKDDAMLKRVKGVPPWIRVTAALSELCIVIDSSIRVLIQLNPEWNLFPGIFLHFKLWNRKENIKKQDSIVFHQRKRKDSMAIEIDDTEYITNRSIQKDETHLRVVDSMEMMNVRQRSSRPRRSL